MKLKHLPEDFQVEEHLAEVPEGGRYALYRLTKRGLGTPEAVEAVRRRWKLPQDALSFCGLKDRYALTTQHVTIRGGPRRGLRQSHLKLAYVGQVPRELCSSDIQANHFRITVRDLGGEQLERLDAELKQAARDGVANYFDRQRFGSLGASRRFTARAWCRREHEQALRLALADPLPSDRPADRQRKKLLDERWGDWAELARTLPGGPPRDVAVYLAGQPDDFRRAIARIPVAQRRLHLEAYQSFLWNRVLASLVRQTCRPGQLMEVELPGHTAVLYRELDESQRALLVALRLPLPAARQPIEEGTLKVHYEEVFGQEGLRRRDLQVDYPRDSFFSKGDRAAVFVPQAVRSESSTDEVYGGRQKLVLAFELPRGCYATMLVQRLVGAQSGEGE